MFSVFSVVQSKQDGVTDQNELVSDVVVMVSILDTLSMAQAYFQTS